MNNEQRNDLNKKRQVVGEVVSNAMVKSIVVKSLRRKLHPLYGKYIVISKKYMAHDERQIAKCGDTVLLTESKPISKRKRWQLQSVLKHAT